MPPTLRAQRSSSLPYPVCFPHGTYTTHQALGQGLCPGGLCLLSVEREEYDDRASVSLVS